MIDSKNRQSWQNAFATKLREDQKAVNADHAVLSALAFPSGKKELCVEAGVIVCSPARLVTLIAILRNSVIKLCLMGLSNKERADKMEALYRFIASDGYSQRVGELNEIADAILEIDVQERTQHGKWWEKRGTLAKRQKRVLTEIDAEVTSIIHKASKSAL